ncbi:pathogenesis-related protein 1A-like [Coffea arabica]|uniref:Pathogenesis-related protein 1A-like n=1 Tax=Coffea arabica TaxID=13443 RepID=A0A6P6VDZ0_COFAR|nr:pathogenesis-related protein 1A-like [Coffea arabica]XP_027101183.1 pathogenesis-related protein 1A-like [Coffea arabica]XP_027125552.1 pathogenesis-related protein 1A-like [Coffea arabica]XP_027125553.1 pathogenesis-related protein 1A-like [Coffea arabica]XP_027125554.1 pathogenesis-related protein 1A-like [Coffea arabica]
MGSFKIFLAVFSFIHLVIFWPSGAQNSKQDYLDVHNAARAQVGVGPIAWDDTVAGYAHDVANYTKKDCNLRRSGGPYGENLAEGSGDLTARDAVNLWLTEKQFYDYNSNTCAQGQACSHYTQVVWNRSVGLGCARVQCTNNGWWFVICSYYPSGNYIGQRPYLQL